MKAETYWPQRETDNFLRADRILYRKVYRKGTPDSMNHNGKRDESNYTIYRTAAYHIVTFRRFSFFCTTIDKLKNNKVN